MVTVAGVFGPTVPFVGLNWNQGVPLGTAAVPLKDKLTVEGFVIWMLCDAGAGALGVLVKRSPVGCNDSPGEWPAGATLMTTVIVCWELVFTGVMVTWP